MSISSADDEIKSVMVNPASTSGGGDGTQQQIDAEEDREIVGITATPGNVGATDQVQASIDVYVGSDPEPAADQSKDLGGKFHWAGAFAQDATGAFAWSDLGPFGLDSPELSWDWNEDVTLTADLVNTAGDDASLFVTVYYREV